MKLLYFSFCLHLFFRSIQCFAGNENYFSGAASAGMGNASVCSSDLWSCINNQAGLAYLKNISAGINYGNRFLLKELGSKTFAAAIPVNGGTFGISLNNYGYALYKENKYALAFAKKLGENFAAGIQIDYLNTYIGENYGSKKMLTAEIGFIIRPSKYLCIGAHIYNPNRTKISTYANERIPTILKLGANYKFSEKVTVAFQADKNVYQNLQFKMGFEYSPAKDFFIRAGIASDPAQNSFGFGFILKAFSIDIASSWHPVLGFTPVTSLTYKFSGSEK